MTQMSDRNTLVRSLHDLGLAAWFGGSLAAAVAVNGAAEQQRPTQQLSGILAAPGRWLRAAA